MPIHSGIHYSLHESEEASTSRPPLVLIHGAGGSFLNWHPYVRRLEGVTVYALDLPGHGQSAGSGRATIAEYAQDVLRFLQALQIQKPVLAGFSMGSAIALTLVLNDADKFSGLALLGGGAKMRVAKTFLETAGSPEAFESAVETINANCFSPHASQDLVRLSKQSMLKIGPSALLGDLLACDQFDVTDQVTRIAIPTLILCGALDVMTPPKFSISLHEQISNSQLRVLEKAGHMVMLEKPDAVADLLKQFVDGLPPLS